MKLYSFFNSSASFRVRIALALKGIEHQTVGINIRRGEQRNQDYLTLNPPGLVPTLINDKGEVLNQSLAIIDWLDREYPQVKLIPLDARRSQVLEIAYAIACDIHPINNMRVLKFLTQDLGLSEADKQRWYAHWVNQGLSAVEQMLSRQPPSTFCIGETPTLADCCLIPQWANALRMNCDMSAWPRCAAIYEACMSMPAFIAAAPENQSDKISA